MSYSKDNLAWLGTIPDHWQVSKLRQVLSPFSEKNHPDMPLLSVVREKGVIIRNVESKEENHNYVPDDLSNYKLVKQGQFTMNKMKAWQGSYGVSKYDGIVSPAYFVFNFKCDINRDFFNAAIRSKAYVSYFGQASDGIRVGQWDLSMARMKDIPFLVPPREEQDQIVRFLDWKVSSINKLISNYRHQIVLLEEMKQRKIDEAVVKGMRKSALIHNHDVRWDIDYPEHWQIRRIRESFSFRKGLSITKANLVETGIAVISYGQVHSKKNSGVGLNEELIRYVNESYLTTNQSCLVEKGDFIFADTSEDVTGCGNCAYIDWDDTIFAGYHSIIAHPDGSTNNKYLAYLFKSLTWRYQIRKKVNGVKVYSITQKMLKDVFIKEALLLKQALSLCSSLIDEKTRMEAAFFESVRTMTVRLVSGGTGKKFTLPEVNERINELLKHSIKSEGVINLFSDVQTEFSLFDPKFLEEVANMKEKNLAVELLKKLISEQVSVYRRTNIVKSEKFSEIIQSAMNRYLNGMLTNEEVIQELLKLAKDIAAAAAEGEKLGLTADELAFYDALTKPQAIKDFYQHDELIAITKELTDMLRKNRTIDWQKKESARAGMRRLVKRLLKKHKYPPEGMDDAGQTVMSQCEMWVDNP